ncbi:MAG: hypothetical protein V3W19_01140 [Desulfatiglandales bacterium]
MAGIITVLSIALPPLWRSLEAFSPSVDYRVPYDFSEDYWLYKQYCRSVGDKGKVLVIGDSVVWGHYVGRDQTLTHSLNELAGDERFINLGLDGSHPMALFGLIQHYGKAIKGEKVILHMNLLWLSSQEADLQTEKEFHFNHPRLVPQFRPQIPCYTESASGRMGIVLERFFPILQLVRHLQVLHFDNTNLQLWTLENPYSNPLGRISIRPPGLGKETEVDSQSRTARGQVLQSLPWVEFETSLQWWAFQRLVELLEARGNDVFVVVGPLNEHVLSPDSIQKYRELLIKAESRLEQMNVPYALLPLLPRHLYADTSHPLPHGYRLLAEHIWNRLK